jgi:tetratricopeptide (TPR) repeat protein
MKIETEKLVFLIKVLTFFSFFTPLVLLNKFFFPFVGPKSLYFMGLTEIIFFLWILLILIDKNYRPKLNFVLIFLLIYLFSAILSTIFGINPSYSFWSKHERMTGLLMQFHLFAFFLVLSSTFKKEDFGKFFVGSISVALLVGLIAILNVNNQTMRGGGTLGNESFLGTYLLFNIFFVLYLFFQTKKEVKIFSIVSFFILAFFLLHAGVSSKNINFSDFVLNFFYKSGARAVKISLYGALILIFLLWLIKSKNKILKFGSLIPLILGVVVLIYAIYSVMFVPGSFFRKMLEKEVGSFGGRFYVWQTTKEAFLERPVFGFGPENFEFAFLRHYNPCFGREPCGGDIWYDRAHNVIFDTLVSQGIIGLISYFILLFGPLFILWKKYLKKEVDFWTSSIFTALFSAYFIQNLTVFDMISSYLMFFLSLSFISCLEISSEKKEIKKTFDKQNEIGIFTFLTLFFIFSLSFYYFIILPFSSSSAVINFLSSQDFQAKENFLKKALSSPLGKTQIREFLAREVLNRTKFSQTEKEKKAYLELLDLIEPELEKNIKENPLDYRSYLTLGEVLTFKGATLKNQEILNKAKEILKKAIEISPKNQHAFVLLGQNYFVEGKKEDAIFYFQKAVDLDKYQKIYNLYLVNLLYTLGEKELTKQKIDEALKINPEWKKDFEKFLVEK